MEHNNSKDVLKTTGLMSSYLMKKDAEAQMRNHVSKTKVKYNQFVHINEGRTVMHGFLMLRNAVLIQA